MTWQELVALEPGLEDLREEISAIADPGPPEIFCRYVAWRPLKRRMRRLLDRHVEHLGAEYFRAHDEAYRVLLNTLPECRGCRCNRGLTRAEREEEKGYEERNDAERRKHKSEARESLGGGSRARSLSQQPGP